MSTLIWGRNAQFFCLLNSDKVNKVYAYLHIMYAFENEKWGLVITTNVKCKQTLVMLIDVIGRIIISILIVSDANTNKITKCAGIN